MALIAFALVAPLALDVTTYRPPSSAWKRTLCGSPSGKQPAQPATKYTEGVDHPGADLPPCGATGCVLANIATNLACEAKCNETKGCYAYVFAPAECSGAAGPICWTKSALDGAGTHATCRNSRGMAKPETSQADIPSRWAADVSADATPLTKYPRPQMVRGSGSAAALREDGDASLWSNLNGLWEVHSLASPPLPLPNAQHGRDGPTADAIAASSPRRVVLPHQRGCSTLLLLLPGAVAPSRGF
jgi:hypothetical protein